MGGCIFHAEVSFDFDDAGREVSFTGFTDQDLSEELARYGFASAD